MKAATKVFSVLAMSTSLGQMLEKVDDEKLQWRARKLYEAGFEASKKYPFPALTKSNMKSIKAAVDRAFPDTDGLDLVQNISFLLCGLEDICEKTNKNNMTFIIPVIKRLLWLQQLIDPKMDKSDLYRSGELKYNKWIQMK